MICRKKNGLTWTFYKNVGTTIENIKSIRIKNRKEKKIEGLKLKVDIYR